MSVCCNWFTCCHDGAGCLRGGIKCVLFSFSDVCKNIQPASNSSTAMENFYAALRDAYVAKETNNCEFASAMSVVLFHY